MLNIWLKIKNNTINVTGELVEKSKVDVVKDTFTMNKWKNEKNRILNDFASKLLDASKNKTINNVKVILSSEKIFYDIQKIAPSEYKNRSKIFDALSEMYQAISEDCKLIERDNHKRKDIIKYFVVSQFEYNMIYEFKELFKPRKFRTYFEIELLNNKINKEDKLNGVNIIVNNENVHICGYRDSEFIEYLMIKAYRGASFKDLTDYLFEISECILVKYVKIYVLNEADLKIAENINVNLKLWMGNSESYEIIKI